MDDFVNRKFCAAIGIDIARTGMIYPVQSVIPYEGNHPNLREKTNNNTSPNTNVGTAASKNEIREETVSVTEYCFTAAHIPKGIPIIVETIIPVNANFIVTIYLGQISWKTGCLVT